MSMSVRFVFQLIGRFGTIEECGEACMFLAAEGTFCTGVDLNLSGGAELNYGFKNMRKKSESFPMNCLRD